MEEIIVQKEDIMHDYIEEHNLTSHIITVENQIDALRLLSSGKHDAALLARLQGQYNAHNYKLTNIQAVGPSFQPKKYCFAVTEGNTELLTQLNEGLNIIKATGLYDEIHQKWFSVYEKENYAKVILKYMIWVLTPLGVLLLSAFLWSWSLKKQISLKTKELRLELDERKKVEKALRKSEEELRKHQDHLEEMIVERTKELKKSMEEITTLQGIVPICAKCKKIRDDKGYWNHIESYIEQHSEASFSHSLCPECMEKLYPDFME